MKRARQIASNCQRPAAPRARYETPRLIALGRVTDLTQVNSAVKNVGPPDGQNPARPN
jgi:hypothetical protein